MFTNTKELILFGSILLYPLYFRGIMRFFHKILIFMEINTKKISTSKKIKEFMKANKGG